MTTNNFEPEISNANFNSAQYYIDDDGSFKFTSPILASSNFDGSIPIFEGEIDAENLNTGMLIKLDDDQYYGILSIFKDDPDLEDDPSTEITIEYLDSDNNAQRITYDFSDTVEVRYEDWDEKYLGSQGWALTYGGNAIFANVGVRGRIEATEGEIEGNLIVSGGLYTSEDAETSGGIVLNNSGFTSYNTSGSTTFNIDAETGTVTIGGYATIEDVESSSAYFETILDDINDRISASISGLTIDLNSLSASVDFLYDAGFVTDSDLVTTGGTTINGNNITTGIINANLVNISSGLTGDRGIKLTSLGLTAYNSSNQPTFNINSGTGTVTITGYATDSDLDEYVAEDELYNPGTTTISGGKIRTGTIQSTGYEYSGGNFSTRGMQIALDSNGYIRSPKFYLDGSGNAFFTGDITGANGTFNGTVSADNITAGTITGSTFRSSGAINSTSGTGVYLDSSGNVRFSNTNATLTFNSSGLSISGAGVTIGGTNPSNFLETGDAAEDINNGITTINGGKITTGTITADQITAAGIFGKTVGTNSAGRRVVLSAASNNILFYEIGGGFAADISPVTIRGTTGITVTGAIDSSTFLEASTDIYVGNAVNPGSTSSDLFLMGSAYTGYLNCLPVYNRTPTSTAANIVIGSNGRFIRSSSSERYKEELVPLSNELLDVDIDKVIDSSIAGYVDYYDVLSLATTQFIGNDIPPIPNMIEIEIDGKIELVPEEIQAPKSMYLGFVAEDVAAKFPIAAEWNEAGEPESYDYRAILAAIVAVVKDQQETIEELQGRVLQLETQLGG